MIWTTRQTIDDDVNKSKLDTTLRVHALEWIMRFMCIPHGGTANTLDEIQTGLFEEFKKPKSEAHYITELKQINSSPMR